MSTKFLVLGYERLEDHKLVEELQETWRLSPLECEQQNLTSTYEQFLNCTVFIPIHTINLFPNHAF